MAPHHFIAVAVRLFAIWLFVLIAMNIPYYFLSNPVQSESVSALPFLLTSAIVVLLGLGLWRFPLTVANRLLPSDAKETTGQADPDLWFAMGCALMGLWLLAKTIPSFVHDAVLVNTEYARQYPNKLSFLLSSYLPKTIIGVWLLFGAKGFRKLFWWMRNAGRTT